MQPTTSLFDTAFEDKVLYLFDCGSCLRTVQNQSINHHRLHDCSKWKHQQVQFKKAFQKNIHIAHQQLSFVCSKTLVEKFEIELRSKKEKFTEKVESFDLKTGYQSFNCCPICLESTQSLKNEREKEKVSSLCNNGHKIHDMCIIQMIRFQMRTCPLCRQQVEKRLFEWLSTQPEQILKQK